MANPTNIYVPYKGGGYDGCFWEWNYFLFDHKGVFHDIASSGYSGIDNEADALALLADEGEDCQIDLTDRDSILFFQSEFNEGHVIGSVATVNKIYSEQGETPPMFFLCDICECECSDGMAEGHQGCGGIAIQATQKVCEDCYCSHTCGYCGEFYEDTSDFDEEGQCEYCTDTTAEQREAQREEDRLAHEAYLVRLEVDKVQPLLPNIDPSVTNFTGLSPA
jgi:hypothetical protein